MSKKKTEPFSSPDGDDPARTPADNDASYRVGYKHPPRETRFQKGKSGNPKGRPGKPKQESGSLKDMLVREMASYLRLPDGTRLRKDEAFVRKLYTQALKCEPKAVQQVISILEGSTRRGLSEKDVDERVQQKLIEKEELMNAEINKGAQEFKDTMMRLVERMGSKNNLKPEE